MPNLSDLKVKLFTDGADKTQIVEMAKQRWISGFTTNPSLLKKAGVRDYAAYARDLVAAVPDRHISFEVFSDDIPEMVAQARTGSGFRGGSQLLFFLRALFLDIGKDIGEQVDNIVP